MKVLTLSDNYPHHTRGGAGRVAFNLAKGLQARGHEVTILTTTQNKNNIQKGEHNIYSVYVPYYHVKWMAYQSLYNPYATKQIKTIIQKIKPDVVHAHNVHRYLSYHSLKIVKKYSKAVFLTAHDVMLYNYGKSNEFINPKDLSIKKDYNYKVTAWQQIKRFKKRYNPFRNIIIRHYLKYVDKIFPVSNTLKTALAQNKITNTHTICNSVDSANWQPIPEDEIQRFKNQYNIQDKKIVFYSGGWDGLKGAEKLIRSLQKVTYQVKDVVLLIAGEEDKYSGVMAELAQELNVTMIFTGWLEGENLKKAYLSSHIIAVPSICLDVFNLTNIEAMICKKPVVGTCFGGTPEIVEDGKTGHIVNPLNIDMMADKIIDLLDNPAKAKQFGEAGYTRVMEKFTLSRQVEETLEWYNKHENIKTLKH